MTLRLFEGPAGSGKTTRLFNAAAEYLKSNGLLPEQRVLALTKMHGSRRRMEAKLTEVLGRGKSFECSTLNSFVLGLVRRWRSLSLSLVDPIPPETDFAELADLGATLLAKEAVVKWVAAVHPLVVVDELQDLRDSELAVVKGLAGGMDVLCAADEFQELDSQGECEAVCWAKTIGQVETLTTVHRTNVQSLLAAARAIRDGKPPLPGNAFKIFSTANANVAASYAARNLTWAAQAHHQVAVLSPTGLDKSPFVNDALVRLAEKPFKKDGKSFGPFSVHWEAAAHDELRRCSEMLRLAEDRTILADEILALETSLPSPLLDWVWSRHKLAGICEFPSKVVAEQLGRAHSIYRGHSMPRHRLRIGLTIHQAKNREFDQVIILWPVTIRGDVDLQRRLLYNAVTRARHKCLILVQDPKPKESRTLRAPFAS